LRSAGGIERYLELVLIAYTLAEMSLTRFGGHPILETGEVANAGNKTTISAGVPGGSCPLGTREWEEHQSGSQRLGGIH
jgi:hypothetical protein